MKRSERAEARGLEISKQRERAERILDAAAALIMRWGFQKTTLDDVSRQAGVAKGTMYLHWKTREDLLQALIRREKLEMVANLKQRLGADPAGTTLRGICKHLAWALMQRPLLKAVLLQDMDVLGKLAHHRQADAAYTERLMSFKMYLELLREAGLVRTDLSLQAQVYIFSAIFIGFFLVAPLLPDEYTFSDEELADMIAETVHCTLEAQRAESPDDLENVTPVFMQYLDRATETAQEEFRKEVEL